MQSLFTLEIAEDEPGVGIRLAGGRATRRVPLQAFLDGLPRPDLKTPIGPPYVKAAWYRGGGNGLLTAVLCVFPPGPTLLSWSAGLLEKEEGADLLLDLPYVVVPLLFKTLGSQTTILTDARLLFAQEDVTWETPLLLSCLPNVAFDNDEFDPRQRDDEGDQPRGRVRSRMSWLCFTPFRYSLETLPVFPAGDEPGQVARLIKHLFESSFNDSAQRHERLDCWHAWLAHPHPRNTRMRSLRAWQTATRKEPGFALKEQFWPMISEVTGASHTVESLVAEMLERVRPAPRVTNREVINMALRTPHE